MIRVIFNSIICLPLFLSMFRTCQLINFSRQVKIKGQVTITALPNKLEFLKLLHGDCNTTFKHDVYLNRERASGLFHHVNCPLK